MGFCGSPNRLNILYFIFSVIAWIRKTHLVDTNPCHSGARCLINKLDGELIRACFINEQRLFKHSRLRTVLSNLFDAVKLTGFLHSLKWLRLCMHPNKILSYKINDTESKWLLPKSEHTRRQIEISQYNTTIPFSFICFRSMTNPINGTKCIINTIALQHNCRLRSPLWLIKWMVHTSLYINAMNLEIVKTLANAH